MGLAIFHPLIGLYELLEFADLERFFCSGLDSLLQRAFELLQCFELAQGCSGNCPPYRSTTFAPCLLAVASIASVATAGTVGTDAIYGAREVTRRPIVRFLPTHRGLHLSLFASSFADAGSAVSLARSLPQCGHFHSPLPLAAEYESLPQQVQVLQNIIITSLFYGSGISR